MIKDNILKIKERIALICSEIRQGPQAITIVAVSKGRTAEQIKDAIAAGITDIGENRIQEATIKHKQLSAIDYGLSTTKWHMVGHLQTNKVKEAVTIFNLIQSVDSLGLAEEINKQAARINKVQEILVEVKTSPEAAKFGIKPEEAVEVIKEMSKYKNINIKGMMTIAPVVDDPEEARPYFRKLRELSNEINALSAVNCQMSTLSMGMTDDFEVAIEEGSNMIRLGRAIFEG